MKKNWEKLGVFLEKLALFWEKLGSFGVLFEVFGDRGFAAEQDEIPERERGFNHEVTKNTKSFLEEDILTTDCLVNSI